MLQNLIHSRGITLTYLHAFCLIIKVTDAISKKEEKNSKQHEEINTTTWDHDHAQFGPVWGPVDQRDTHARVQITTLHWLWDPEQGMWASLLPSWNPREDYKREYIAWQEGGSQTSVAISLNKLLSQSQDHHDPDSVPCFLHAALHHGHSPMSSAFENTFQLHK